LSAKIRQLLKLSGVVIDGLAHVFGLSTHLVEAKVSSCYVHAEEVMLILYCGKHAVQGRVSLSNNALSRLYFANKLLALLTRCVKASQSVASPQLDSIDQATEDRQA
jgi:hypothetical protein